jgi:hypothetical protein
VESGGLDVTVSSLFGQGDFLEFQLSGAQLFSGSVNSPTVSTGIFPVIGAGGAGARYQGPADSTCCASASVSNVLVIITVQSGSGPVITGLSPNSIASGSAGFPLTVTGTGFQSGALVQWNGATLLTQPGSATQLIATVPSNLVANAGIFSVTVVNPGPVTSNVAVFTVGLVSIGTLTISTPTLLPSGQIGTFYAQQLLATGGTPPYSWALLSGSFPAGLSLSPSGVISGTPTALGTSSFNVTVADNNFASAGQTFSLTINPKTFDFTSALRVAQIVDGQTWKTLFAIVNLDSVPVNYVTRFWDDNGNSLALPLLNGTPGTLAGTVAVGGTAFAETPGGTSTALSQGWAEVSSTGRIGVLTIFRSSIPGKPDAEGTVTGVSSGNRIWVPFDNTQGFTTGIALANTNPSQPITVSVLLQLENGSQTSGSIFLPAHAHVAFVAPTRFPFIAGARGSILFTAPTADLTVVGLQFTPTGSFTSLGSFQ